MDIQKIMEIAKMYEFSDFIREQEQFKYQHSPEEVYRYCHEGKNPPNGQVEKIATDTIQAYKQGWENCIQFIQNYPYWLEKSFKEIHEIK